MQALTQRTKAFVDMIASLLGAVFGLLISQAPTFGDKAPYLVIVGTIGGYAVSDVLTFVDTGQAPTPSVIAGQASAAWTVTRPTFAAELAKLPSVNQSEVNLALAVLDKYLAAQPTTSS